jgi:hypothetical protein
VEDDVTGRTGIHGQRYNEVGEKTGGELTLASDPNHSLHEPSVAMNTFGYFVLAYTYDYSASDHDIYWGSYDAYGSTEFLFSEAPVATSTLYEYQPTIAYQSDSPYNVVIAWTLKTTSTNSDVKAATGDFITGSINSYFTVAGSTNSENNPKAVIMAYGGAFAVAYQSTSSTNNGDILLKRFDASANPLGTTTVANGTAKQQLPSLAIDNNGNMVVAWQEYSSTTGWDIKARRVNSGGAAGAIVTVNATSGNQTAPAVALDPSNGTYMVAYKNGTSVDVTEVKGKTVQGTLVAGGGVTAGNRPLSISMRGDHYYLLVFVETNGGFFTDPGLGVFGVYGLPS